MAMATLEVEHPSAENNSVGSAPMTKISNIFSSQCIAIIVLLGCIAGTALSQTQPSNTKNGSSYFPLSVGNQWQYISVRSSTNAASSIKWSVTQRELVHGVPVYHLWLTPPEGDEPLNLAEVEGGILEDNTDRFVLKNPLHEGQQWRSTSHSLRANSKSDTSKVISAGKACSVGERTFDDCAIVREVDEANDIASLTTYARGVGPVKYVYFKPVHSSKVDTTLTIKSWKVQ